MSGESSTSLAWPTKFPHLSALARCYLTARASSVDNERVFSCTGKLLEPKRCRLSVNNGSILAFLYHNIKHVAFDYEWPN